MGKSKERIAKLERDNERLRDELHSLWFRVNRLLEYLGLSEVTYPQETFIQAVDSERVVTWSANTKTSRKLAKKSKEVK